MKLPLSHGCSNDVAEAVDDEWPEATVCELDDTQRFTEEQLAEVLNNSSEHRCPTLRAFPAPPSERRVRAA